MTDLSSWYCIAWCIIVSHLVRVQHQTWKSWIWRWSTYCDCFLYVCVEQMMIERLPTCSAVIRFLSSVDHLMCFQVSWPNESASRHYHPLAQDRLPNEAKQGWAGQYLDGRPPGKTRLLLEEVLVRPAGGAHPVNWCECSYRTKQSVSILIYTGTMYILLSIFIS